MIEFIIVGIIYVVPALVLLKNYLIIRLYDYLVFATIFVLSALATMLTSFEWEPILPSQYYFTLLFNTTLLVHFNVIILCMLILGKQMSDPLKYVLIVIYGSVFLLIIVLAFLSNPIKILEFSISTASAQALTLQIPRIITGIFIVYTFKVSNPVKQTPRNNRVNLMWRTIGIIQIITPILLTSHILYTIIAGSGGTYPPQINAIQLNTYGITLLISNLLTSSIALVISVFYPDAMLFTKDQLLRAKKLYDIIENDELEGSKGKYFPFTKSILTRYINDLPADILAKINKTGH